MQASLRPEPMACRVPLLLLLVSCVSLGAARAQTTVRGRIELEGARHSRKAVPTTVVWLTPLNVTGAVPKTDPATGFRLVQKNKSFDPHILVVPVGSVVEFPNHDPFFHNVFSLFEGKRFDLGLYEAGSTREVRFDKPGISYIFCNIHAQMSAVVIALDTPYYTVSNQQGEIVVADVPPGRYFLHIWAEGTSPDNLKTLTRAVNVSDSEHSIG